MADCDPSGAIGYPVADREKFPVAMDEFRAIGSANRKAFPQMRRFAAGALVARNAVFSSRPLKRCRKLAIGSMVTFRCHTIDPITPQPASPKRV